MPTTLIPLLLQLQAQLPHPALNKHLPMPLMEMESRYSVKDKIPEERRYGMIDRNYTPFQSNVLCWRGMYLAIVERMLWRRGKDIGVENNLLNGLGFNLCVVPQSLVVKLVAYFGVKEVVKTEVLRGRVKESEWTRRG